MSEIVVREDAREVVIESGFVVVSVHLNRGTFDIVATGESPPAAVRDCAASVKTREGGRFSSRGNGFDFEGTVVISDARGKGIEALLRRDRHEHEPDLSLTITVYESQPYVLLRAEMKNAVRTAVHVESFEPLAAGRVDLPDRPASWRFYKHGWQSWSPTLVLPCSGEDENVLPPVLGPGTSVEARSGRFVSDMVTAIVEPRSQAGVVTGFVTAADQFSQAWLDRDDASFSAASYADGRTVAPGATLASETLCVQPAKQPLAALESYGEVLSAMMGATPYDEVASGWCSWYRYFTGVTEEQVMANLEYLAAHKDELPVRYVQLDDGYQAGIGDWLDVNEKFPHGLKWLVEQVHDAGFEAGLWLAPFLVGANSRLSAEHPEWLVQYKSGTPSIATFNWGQVCYGLDLSRDDVIEWLREVFRTVTRDWGFDYVKIDFVYAGALEGLRSDERHTRAQCYRRGLETVRDAVGDRFVLGCGNPIGTSVGLVDGSRVGPDVAPSWQPAPFPPMPQRNALSEPSALNSIRSTISRYWMHGRLWQNDPDCVLVRATDTSLTADEVRTLATVIAMTGGMVLDSDDLTALPDERREMLSLLLPVYGRSARPLDLFASDMPRVLELDCGSHRMIATFNWEEEDRRIPAGVGEERSHVFDGWERRYLGQHSGEIVLDVPPHGCRLIAVRPAAPRPQIIGSSFHLLQGACEIAEEEWSGSGLRVSLRPVAVKRGALFIAMPEGLGPPAIEGADAEVTDAGDGVWSVSFDLREPVEVSIDGTAP